MKRSEVTIRDRWIEMVVQENRDAASLKRFSDQRWDICILDQ